MSHLLRVNVDELTVEALSSDSGFGSVRRYQPRREKTTNRHQQLII